MITGIVNVRHEATIPLSVCDTGGQEHEIEAIVDTGFDGWLTLPTAVIAALGLTWQRRGRATLADGSKSIFDIYEATVIWDGQPRTIPIDTADTDPLIGMSLLYGYNLHIQVIDSGSVTIEALP